MIGKHCSAELVAISLLRDIPIRLEDFVAVISFSAVALAVKWSSYLCENIAFSSTLGRFVDVKPTQ
jgi:hypothetical protein